MNQNNYSPKPSSPEAAFQFNPTNYPEETIKSGLPDVYPIQPLSSPRMITPNPKFFGLKLKTLCLGLLSVSAFFTILEMVLVNATIINRAISNIGPFITFTAALFGFHSVWSSSLYKLRIFFWLFLLGIAFGLVKTIVTFVVLYQGDFNEQIERSCNSDYRNQPFGGAVHIYASTVSEHIPCDQVASTLKKRIVLSLVWGILLAIYQKIVLYVVNRFIKYVSDCKRQSNNLSPF